MLAILILAVGLTAFNAPGFGIAIIATFLPALAAGNNIGGRVGAAAAGPRQGRCVTAGAALAMALGAAVMSPAMPRRDAAIRSRRRPRAARDARRGRQ
ncbi:MAG: hypothetical protein M9932_12600 [Xanthobacteraceae bacterium]|nr:hypothetical protein [Xanthobacteraceae bacterium]